MENKTFEQKLKELEELVRGLEEKMPGVRTKR